MSSTDTTVNPTSKAAEQKRKAAERARRSRAKKKASRAPDTRAVDAAVSEATSFHLARDGATTAIIPIDMMKTARLILEREGYALAAAAKAIAARLSHRDEHLWPDHVPTLKPGDPRFMRETRNGPWDTALDAILDHLAG